MSLFLIVIVLFFLANQLTIMFAHTEIFLSESTGFVSDRPKGGTQASFMYGARIVDSDGRLFNTSGYL